MSQIKVTYVDHMGNDLTPVNAARISFNTESRDLDDKDKKLVQFLARNQHMSPFEHNTLTVIVECPLYIRSQIHRHRTFAYNEVSRRYTSDNLEFFIPDSIRKQSKSNRQASDGELDPAKAQQALDIIQTHHKESEDKFNKLIELGVPREQARAVLPQDLMTRFYMTGNLRNWAHFLNLRLDSHAQVEVQQMAQNVRAILEEKFPHATKVLLEEHDASQKARKIFEESKKLGFDLYENWEMVKGLLKLQEKKE